MKRGLNTHMVPLLSVFAAFSFIIMMFNLPLPGGTTGHAVGVGIAAIVLGPWASILAISIALVIQALLFGDGGITAIGANCFNMAILGSLAAYGIYRLLAGRAPIESPRRVMARRFAGYAGDQSERAGCRDRTRDPAAAVSRCRGRGAVRSVSVADRDSGDDGGTSHGGGTGGNGGVRRRGRVSAAHGAELAARYAPGAQEHDDGGWRATKPLWIALAVLAILTPLGILAAGSAWGEWAVSDFLHPETRQQIANASRGKRRRAAACRA